MSSFTFRVVERAVPPPSYDLDFIPKFFQLRGLKFCEENEERIGAAVLASVHALRNWLMNPYIRTRVQANR